MKNSILSFALILFGLGLANGQTTVDIELSGTSTDLDVFMFEVQLAFDVPPDSMGTGNEMGSGWQQYEPNYTFTMFPAGTLSTEYYWEESITNLSMYITVICGEDTTILPPIDFESNTPNDIVYAVSVDVGCGDGDIEWDCPELMSNFGWGCQDGWGIIDENCDCIEYIEPENCLEFYLPGTDSTLFDPASLLVYALMECGNQDNPEPWIFCGLAESISEAMAGDEDACNEVAGWILANDWDGTWDPGNGGNDFDCPELFGNIGEPCGINQGTFGVINEDCECIEIQGCGDFEVSTNLLSNDDGTGNGSVEATASGGTPPYSYEWEAWAWEVIGTDAVLDNCVAGVYFVQATDFNGCVAFGNEEVLFSVDTLEWDCPNLSMNVGDPCQGGWGIIDEDCECIEDMEIGGCEALFTIDQAINEEDGEAVLFALFVYLWNYDESNEYYWSFGDEGGSSDPFPVWTYESNGPYEICLTVSNELEECSNTYCSTIGVDTLGWDNGLQDGFTITIINGDEDSQSLINEENTSLGFEVFPNPTTGNEINMNWFGESNEKVTCKLIDITGKAVSFKTWFPSSESEQLSMNIDDVNSGMYLLKMDQGSRNVTSRVIINR